MRPTTRPPIRRSIIPIQVSDYIACDAMLRRKKNQPSVRLRMSRALLSLSTSKCPRCCRCRRRRRICTRIARTPAIARSAFATPQTSPNPNLLNLLKSMPDVTAQQLKPFPGESFDHVVPNAGGPNGFLTSSQCMGCHSATNDDMLYPFGESNQKPINLSPYTEWRASMMGLAGRDPIFHAQLESEKALYPSRTEFFDNTCYRCHGVMGQRQVELDRNQPFKHSMVFALPDDPDGKYGALARDGVSCDACHRIAKEGLGTPATFTGQFKLDPANAVNGPYDQLATVPMKNAMGIT